jgi:hypothetical protein
MGKPYRGRNVSDSSGSTWSPGTNRSIVMECISRSKIALSSFAFLTSGLPVASAALFGLAQPQPDVGGLHRFLDHRH